MTNEDYIKKILEIHDKSANCLRKATYYTDGFFVDYENWLMHICKPKEMYLKLDEYSSYKYKYYNWKILQVVNLSKTKYLLEEYCNCGVKVPKLILMKTLLEKL